MKTLSHPKQSQLSRQTNPLDNTLNGFPPTPRSQWLLPFRDSMFGIGLGLLLMSAGAYVLYEWFGVPQSAGGGNGLMIMLHYGLFLLYGISMLINGHWRIRGARAAERRPVRWLGLLLWLISAYALNREIPVFQQSTEWLCWTLVTVGTAMVVYGWKETLPVRAQQLLYVVLSAGFWLFAYMAVYIVELYPVSIPALIALGLSSHTFVPITFAIVLGKRLWLDTRREEHLRPGVAVGLAIPVVAVILFLMGWSSTLNRIDRVRMESTIRRTNDLPDWVLMAQQLTPNWLTNRLLLTDRVFDKGRFFDGNWGMSGLTSFDDRKQHDPLVVIASRLLPVDGLPATDQLNLLNVLNGDRHTTEEKFWLGRHLTTEDVVSQVRIWPQFRLSYTEKTIRIRNQARNTTEEALFTFHLPPGSVVSAMSLWVNNREEPARLTTVAKADSAYRQIVNVESKVIARDPSVVYWQEGNRITVRVFPCRAGQDRRVKLGITSPLALNGGQLTYQNPYFDGPDAQSADELIQVDFAATPTDLHSPWLFDHLSGTTLTHRGQYDPDWSLQFNAPALSTDAFVLDGRGYRMETYQSKLESFRPTDVYLDVNEQWTKNEFTTAFQTATQQHQRVWVFADGLKQVSAADVDDTYEQLSGSRFSLFPVYRIANPALSLLITKGTPSSPTLSDLKGSTFAQRMQRTANQPVSIRTFCFGNDLSPYLKTLAELRVLAVTHGTTDELINFSRKACFPSPSDEPDRIVLPTANVAIRETTSPTLTPTPAAPDHLARLFTYNHLLGQIGRHYFMPNYQTDALIGEAQRAHIVSPLSSLVALETAADYKRFGITKDNVGLSNATLKEEGAVPEPHEWALLAMVTGLVTYLIWKKRYVVG